VSEPSLSAISGAHIAIADECPAQALTQAHPTYTTHALSYFYEGLCLPMYLFQVFKSVYAIAALYPPSFMCMWIHAVYNFDSTPRNWRGPWTTVMKNHQMWLEHYLRYILSPTPIIVCQCMIIKLSFVEWVCSTFGQYIFYTSCSVPAQRSLLSQGCLQE